MTAVVPSYIAKITRAEKHLVELEEAVRAFGSRKPYEVRERVEGKKEKRVRRLGFTSDPANTDIPIIAADVIYNLRSALDHLMAALVANKDRGSAIFPVFFQGVWEAPKPGENAERRKQRDRWASDTKSLKTSTLAILQVLQPPEDAGDRMDANRLRVINSLSNRDRHEKLPISAAGLTDPRFHWTRSGKLERAVGLMGESDGFLKNEARLQIPDDAVDVQIEGTPLVVIRVGQDAAGRDRHLAIPLFLTEAIPFFNQQIVGPLLSHVRR